MELWNFEGDIKLNGSEVCLSLFKVKVLQYIFVFQEKV